MALWMSAIGGATIGAGLLWLAFAWQISVLFASLPSHNLILLPPLALMGLGMAIIALEITYIPRIPSKEEEE